MCGYATYVSNSLAVDLMTHGIVTEWDSLQQHKLAV